MGFDNIDTGNSKKRKILIIVLIIFLGLLILGGTYAFLSYALSVENGNYSGKVECFKINYSTLNEDGTEKITGTLFPSINASNGLSGMVSLGIDESCNVNATGSLYMHVSEGTSVTLLQTVREHCENSLTLETIDEYDNSSDCTDANGIWVTNGTALKYAVYNNNSANGNPLDSGYITANDIGDDILVYTNFDVNYTMNSYYIYIWMDGYLMDDNYTNLPFGGYIHASISQNE